MQIVSSVLALAKVVLSRQECLVGRKVLGDTTETMDRDMKKLVKGFGTALHTGVGIQLAVESTSLQDPLFSLKTARSWVSDHPLLQ